MSTSKQYIPSEKYRQMLVQDANRRFQEWHNRFLSYQQAYLEDMNKRKK
ncbi:hypothetical protein [Pseudanabaena mucicola]|uniref:Uncharacterized protein n=1 Tax=Pseudanabaena mucicola FACHB-723 TaxID=2692860 RepID=A0ABR7ZWD7_9CYAN|nr:hypothetical protein [Pseudanabaena mucicola]MBD2188089.1 hypothetical protein [Pseudanabaena mucicola FACHB-723]